MKIMVATMIYLYPVALAILSPKNQNRNQFYFRRKNTMLTKQQLACDEGEAAKELEWSLS